MLLQLLLILFLLLLLLLILRQRMLARLKLLQPPEEALQSRQPVGDRGR